MSDRPPMDPIRAECGACHERTRLWVQLVAQGPARLQSRVWCRPCWATHIARILWPWAAVCLLLGALARGWFQ